MPRLNLLEETRFEKLPVSVFKDQHSASTAVAECIAKLINDKAAAGEKTVLGLATGLLVHSGDIAVARSRVLQDAGALLQDGLSIRPLGRRAWPHRVLMPATTVGLRQVAGAPRRNERRVTTGII